MRYLSNTFSILITLSLSVLFTNCSSIRLKKDVAIEKKRTHKPRTRKVETTPTDKTVVSHSPLRKNIIQSAMQYQGIQYVYGGKTPTGFDCSGFTSHVFRENGVTLTGASRHQAQMGTAKQLREAEPGDLIFFKNKGKVTHVSIVVDKDDDELWVVHSTSSRGVVKDEILHSSYWKPKIAGVRDILPR